MIGALFLSLYKKWEVSCKFGSGKGKGWETIGSNMIFQQTYFKDNDEGYRDDDKNRIKFLGKQIIVLKF